MAKKKKDQETVPFKRPSRTVDARRGTAVWAVGLYNQDALVSLLDDLESCGATGLTQQQCAQVQLALGKVVNRATAIPDTSFFRREVWKHLQIFQETYVSWNEPKGPGSDDARHRHEKLQLLRKRRNKIATRIRKTKHILDKELDLRIVEGWYEALAVLPAVMPELFKELAKAVGRFAKRKVAA